MDTWISTARSPTRMVLHIRLWKARGFSIYLKLIRIRTKYIDQNSLMNIQPYTYCVPFDGSNSFNDVTDTVYYTRKIFTRCRAPDSSPYPASALVNSTPDAAWQHSCIRTQLPG